MAEEKNDDSILVGANHKINEKGKTTWQREVISRFAFWGVLTLLSAGAYLLIFFYKDTSLEGRTEVLAYALTFLVVFNVMVFFRMLRKPYKR